MGLFWKCAVVVVASTVQSLGLTLQRLSHLDPPLPSSGVWPTPDQRKHSVHLWRTGIALFIGANLFGSTVQLAVLPLVLVCTLQAIGLVANAVFATLILKETLTRFAALGTVLVLVGAMIVAALGGTQSDPDISLSKLLKLFASLRFSLWMFATLAVAGVLISRQASLRPAEFRLKHHDQPPILTTNANVSASASANASFSTNASLNASIATDDTRDASAQAPGNQQGLRTFVPNSHHARHSGWSWGIVGGIASAHSLLMAKLAIGLVVRDFRNLLKDLERLQFWLILVMFLTFALGQMWCVNCGLRYTSTSVLYPLVFCVYNVVEILNSVMLYGMDSTSWRQLGWIAVGTSVLFSGVMLLSTRFDGDQPGPTPTVPAEELVEGWMDWLRGLGKGPLHSASFSDDESNVLPTSYPSLATSRLASPRYDGLRPDSPLSDASISPIRGLVVPTVPESPVSPISAQIRLVGPPGPPLPPHVPSSPQLQRIASSSQTELTTAASTTVGAAGSAVSQHQSTPTRHFSQRNRADSTSSENVPLLNNVTYTSFDSISPSIANPDKVRGRHSRVVLSKEQHQILRELGM